MHEHAQLAVDDAKHFRLVWVDVLVPELGSLLPGMAPSPPLDPEQEKRRHFHSLTQFFGQLAARQPVLAVFEDLHWSDATTLELLLQLGRPIESHRIVLFMTYRNDELHPALADGLLLNSWRDGYWGSFALGLEHGAYCLGCCWLLMVLLFPPGVMNIGAMALIALVMFVEKSTRFGWRTAGLAAPGCSAVSDAPIAMAHQFGWRTAGLAAPGLIVYVVVAMLVPGALPTTM